MHQPTLEGAMLQADWQIPARSEFYDFVAIEYDANDDLYEVAQSHFVVLLIDPFSLKNVVAYRQNRRWYIRPTQPRMFPHTYSAQ